MKQLLVFLILISPGLSANSQPNDFPEKPSDYHKTGDVVLSTSPTVLLKTPNGSQVAGGVKIQLFLSRRFSLDADVMISRNYVHLSPGLIGVPLGLLALSSDSESLTDLAISLAAIALSFEHLSYHIPVTGTFEIAPFLSLLRFKYASLYGDTYEPGFIEEQFCFTTGAQINKYFGRFVLSPYAEYSIGYKDKIPGYNFGVYFGCYFPTKDID